MPRYIQPKLFQIGDYWLSQQARSPAWCRTWFDPQTQQTKRASLKTTDLEEAKQSLTDWFVQHCNRHEQPADEMLVAQVMQRYFEQHAKHISSSSSARTACQYWLDFFGEMTVGEIAPLNVQEEFHRWLASRGLSKGTIKRAIGVGRAALNRAWKNNEISSVPFIHDISVGAVAPKGRPLEMDEIRKLLAEAPPHLWMFCVLMLGTASRPDAIRELTRAQCDFENRLIHLNAAGRTQTKKYRPSVKMPETLFDILSNAPDGFLVQFRGEPVKQIMTSWRSCRARAGLDDRVNPYSLRHTIARWLRKSGVPAWEVAAQLGHRQKEFSTTEIYAPFDPSYLTTSKTAIDAFMVECV